MKKRCLLFLTFIVLSISCFARNLTYKGKVFPYSVNLNYQFPNNPRKQVGGSCHIFAAAAIIDAACFRVMGKQVDISEAYFFNRHLSVEVTQDRQDLVSYLRAKSNDLDLIEGGYPFATVKRFFNGSSCSEKEFPLDPDVITSFEKEAEQLRTRYQKIRFSIDHTVYHVTYRDGKIGVSPTPPKGDRKLAILIFRRDVHKQAYERYKRLLDYLQRHSLQRIFDHDNIEQVKSRYKFHLAQYKRFNKEIDHYTANLINDGIGKLKKILNDQVSQDIIHPLPASAGGLMTHPQDENIRKCMKFNLKVKNIKFPSQEEMLTLLSKKIPFVCDTDFHSPELNGMHSIIVTGYRYRSGYPYNIQYRLRDPNDASPEFGAIKACSDITYIYLKH